MNAETNEMHIRRRQKIQEDKDFMSARISESVRYIGFGLAAVTMAFLTSDASFPKRVLQHYQPFVLICSAFGCVTIVLDYLHYLVGYLSSEQAGRNRDGDFGYLTQSNFYRARRIFFVGRQFTAMFGALVFIVVLISAMPG